MATSPRRRGVLATPNGELERPTADFDIAPCAHNSSGAHGAPIQLSRPLQAFARPLIAAPGPNREIPIRRGGT
jgi:hypothetical protein